MDGNPSRIDDATFARREAGRVARVETQELAPVLSGPVGLWDNPPEAQVEPLFEEIVALARLLTGAEAAAFSVLDHERAWFRARVGVDICSLPKATAYCAYAVRCEDVVEIPDTRRDPLFADHPLTLGYEGLPAVLSYAGVPLYSAAPERACIGTLCVFSTRPHTLSSEARAGLIDLAHHLESHLHARERTRREPETGFYHAPVMAGLIQRAAVRARHAGGALGLVGVVPTRPLTRPAMRLAFAARVGDLLVGHGEVAGVARPEPVPGALLLLLPGSAPVHVRAIAEELRDALAQPGLLDDTGRAARFGLGIAGQVWPAGASGAAADVEAGPVGQALVAAALAEASGEGAANARA